MTRLPGNPGAPVRKADPDIYTVLLLVGVLFLLTSCLVVYLDLTASYGVGLGDLLSGGQMP